MFCTNVAFFGGGNDKSLKSNPWGLHEEKFSLWTCCACFRKGHVAPAEVSKSGSAKVPVRIVSEKEEGTQ